jgi:Glycosyl transferase family group 2
VTGLTAWLGLGVPLLLIPLVVAGVDVAAALRARVTRPIAVVGSRCAEFTVLVPIYGSLRYLENVAYLAGYAERVLLCTTTAETPEFVDGIERLAQQHGFGLFYGNCGTRTGPARRQTAGTTRDRLIRDALPTVRSPYVVCIDADTATERPLDELVGAVAEHGFDLVSVRLEPANTTNWLGRLQAHEYRLAMSLRRVGPWLVSGACHAGRTAALTDVMSRHSLFFQGNDVETGLLAEALGYRVGHLPFVVPTTVPSTVRGWFRQRFAWAGGEFRLFVVNLPMARRHPLLWGYGCVIMFGGLYFRWATVLAVPLLLGVVAAIYLVLLTYLNWGTRDLWLLAMPVYAAVTSLVLVPLALPSYALMAIRSRNAGRIVAGSGRRTC